MEQLICGSLYRMRLRQSLPQAHKPRTGTLVPWKAQRLGAGVWGLWSSPRAKAAVDCRLRGREGGDHGGKCQWRNARQPWKQGNTAESHAGGGAHHHSHSIPHGQPQQLNSREAGPSNARRTEYRAGPHPGGPFKCLTLQSTEWDPSQGGPFKCLTLQSTEWDPTWGAPLCA